MGWAKYAEDNTERWICNNYGRMPSNAPRLEKEFSELQRQQKIAPYKQQPVKKAS